MEQNTIIDQVESSHSKQANTLCDDLWISIFLFLDFQNGFLYKDQQHLQSSLCAVRSVCKRWKELCDKDPRVVEIRKDYLDSHIKKWTLFYHNGNCFFHLPTSFAEFDTLQGLMDWLDQWEISFEDISMDYVPKDLLEIDEPDDPGLAVLIGIVKDIVKDIPELDPIDVIKSFSWFDFFRLEPKTEKSIRLKVTEQTVRDVGIEESNFFYEIGVNRGFDFFIIETKASNTSMESESKRILMKSYFPNYNTDEILLANRVYPHLLPSSLL